MTNPTRSKLNKIGGFLLLLAVLTACSSKSEADKLTKELRTVTSWVATAEMTGEAWTQGNVPTPYTKQTLSTAQKKLHKQTEAIAQLSYDPTQLNKIVEHLQRLESTVNRMSTSVEQQDRSAIAHQLQQLSKQEQTITVLASRAGEQP
jgi:flagellar motility protein MotE (MotC chaperone)